MLLQEKIYIPLEFVLIISGMPGVGKTTLAINLVKKYSEFRSFNQMNLLRYATRYFNNISSSNCIPHEGLRFISHEEAKQHMVSLNPVLESFIKRQLEKKIPTILEGIDFYPPFQFATDNAESIFNKVLIINLFCSRKSIHYTRLTRREKQRQHDPSSVDLYFENIRQRNELVHQEILNLKHRRIRSLDIALLNEKQVLNEVENEIVLHMKMNNSGI